MKYLKNIVALIALLSGLAQVFAQEADATLENNTIMIGDQVDLKLTFIAPNDYTVVFPRVNDTIITEIEVIGKSKIDSTAIEGTNEIRYVQELVITSFDSGYYAIPPFVFLYQAKNSDEYQASETPPLLLSVLNPEVDLNADIKDIKAPIHVPLSFSEIWHWIVIGLAIVAIIWFIVYYIKKKKQQEPVLPFRRKPVLPPHQVALDALEALKKKKLWQAGRIKEYHSELSDIIRAYIDGRFHVHAIEMVTYEILEEIENQDIEEDVKEKLKKLLELADLVKFAKEKPLPEEQEQSMNYAIEFVKNTIHSIESQKVKSKDIREELTDDNNA